MCKSRSSLSVQDFLKRLYYLFDGKIDNLQTDNDSSFGKLFQIEIACENPQLSKMYSSNSKSFYPILP